MNEGLGELRVSQTLFYAKTRSYVKRLELEHFGRIPETMADRDAVIVDKCRTEIREKVAE